MKKILSIALLLFLSTNLYGQYNFVIDSSQYDSVKVGKGILFFFDTIQWSINDSIQGEIISANTVDDDALDLSDITLVDFTDDVNFVKAVDSTGTGSDAFASRTALVDTASNHWTEIVSKEPLVGTSLSLDTLLIIDNTNNDTTFVHDNGDTTFIQSNNNSIYIGRERASFDMRKQISVPAIEAETTDLNVMVIVDYDSDMETDFRDIRFTESDGVTEIDQWMESYVTSDSSIWWIEIPTCPAAGWTGYMYYDKPEFSLKSDGEAVFPLFDDFYGTDGDSASVARWEYSANYKINGNIEIQDSCLIVDPKSDYNSVVMYSDTSVAVGLADPDYDEGFGVRARIQYVGTETHEDTITIGFTNTFTYYCEYGNFAKFVARTADIATDNIGKDTWKIIEIRRESSDSARFWIESTEEHLGFTTYSDSERVYVRVENAAALTNELRIDWIFVTRLPNVSAGGSDTELAPATVGAEQSLSDYEVILRPTNILGDISAQSYEVDVSPTELGYLDGVSSALQTQMDSKLNKADSTGTGPDSYASRTAVVDTASAHWTEINSKEPLIGTELSVDTLTVSDSFVIQLDDSLETDSTYTGVVMSFEAGDSLVAGELIGLVNPGGYYRKVSCDSAETLPAILLVTAYVDSGEIGLGLVQGTFRLNSWNWSTIGERIMAGETMGTIITQAGAPGGGGDNKTQLIGVVMSADQIFFRPNWDFNTPVD